MIVIMFMIRCFLDILVALYTFCCTGVQSEVVHREIINSLKSRGVGYLNVDNSRGYVVQEKGGDKVSNVHLGGC
jgi:hypothetical protein